jgi:hypothetical protein
MLQYSIKEVVMPVATKTASQHRESSFTSILSGWAQQGLHGFFATQRILLDLAMRQNANVMHAVRQQLSDPHHSPTALLSEIAEEGIGNFVEGQKVLLDLGKKQHEFLMTGVEERIGEYPAAHAITELLRRSVDTFIHMQQEFLKIAGKQSHTWVEAAKAGKPWQSDDLIGLAQEGMDNFAKAQKQFLDVIAEEVGHATSNKADRSVKKIKKTELGDLARQATESFIEAQKKLVDLAGKQMNASVKTAGKSVDLLKPFPFPPMAELTREAVKSYVDTQKALMDAVMKPQAKPVTKGEHPKKTKKAAAGA